jgi:hypothetical protein
VSEGALTEGVQSGMKVRPRVARVRSVESKTYSFREGEEDE